MEKKQGFFKKRKKLAILIIVIVAVAAAFILFNQMQKSLLGSLTEAPPELYMLERTNLESKVTASGNFESMDPVTIGSNVLTGEVDAVYVSAGDHVYAGDVLAVLKTTDLLRDISDTKETISESAQSDNLRLSQAQRAVDDAYSTYGANYNQNEKDVQEARDRRDAYTQTVADIQAKIDAEKAKPETDWDLGLLDALDKELGDANIALSGASDALEKAVQLKDTQYRNDYSRILDALDQVNSLKIQNNNRQTRSQLESLEEDLSNAKIVSSITGVVTAVNTEAGRAASGSMFVVENTDSLQIKASIAEYDVIRVEKGQTAHISSNALGDQMFEGVVDYVAPVASDTQGNFEVLVTLTSPVGQLRPGMTATVEIVTESKKDVFSVPIDAVVTKRDGTKVVYAYEPNATIMPIRQGSGEVTEGDIIPGETMGQGMPGGDGSGGLVPGGPGVAVGPNDGSMVVVSSGDTGSAPNYSRREIVVTTGMETDYYIEIFSDELTDGLLILADPEGRNVSATGPGATGAMMAPAMGSTQTVTVVDSGGPRGGGSGAVRIN